MKIGNKIREFRVKKNLSQEYMATVLNISQPYYNKLENNKAKLTVDNMLAIANEFEVDPSELIDSLQPNFSNTFKVNMGQIGTGNTQNNNFSQEEKQFYIDRISALEKENEFLKFVIQKFSIPSD
ncbi:MAG: helix-turn-helix domain-containing protein [Deltaproteobacteria bacterium]